MVIGEIQSALETAQNQPRLKKQLPLLKGMLKAAQAWDSEGIYPLARRLCKLSRKVPPGTYYQSAKSFKFSGQRVTLPQNDATWSLGLVHPQIYR
ncbi:MAG: hypothetical protein QM703_25645 [Gemmatales bacterium]